LNYKGELWFFFDTGLVITVVLPDFEPTATYTLTLLAPFLGVATAEPVGKIFYLTLFKLGLDLELLSLSNIYLTL
jgi:hypothetical protein